MKKTSKLSIIAYLILATFISSCEKDLYDTAFEQQHSRFIYLNGDSALKMSKILNQKMKNIGKLTNRGLDFDELGTVKYDSVLQLIDNMGNITYTFKVDHPESNASKFFNMVLQEKNTGETLIKLFEYQMTPEFAEKYNSGEKSLKDFQGTYAYRLISYDQGSMPIGVDGGGDSGGSDSNDGNTGNPTGNPHAGSGISSGNNNSAGAGALGSGNSGSPCPTGGGVIGGSESAGSSPGNDGGGSGGNSNSTGLEQICYTVTITELCNGGGGHTGESNCTGTNHGYVIQITFCVGGFNRSINDENPCSSSNSGIGVYPPNNVNPTPCEEVKKIGDPTKTNIKPNVDLLKQKVNSAQNNNEIGFVTKRNRNPDLSWTYNNTNVVSANESEIDLNIGYSYIGGGHSHPNTSYAMFSFGDVKHLKESYEIARDENQNEVFFLLTCKNKTGIVNTYVLKVDDINALTTQVDSVLDNQNFDPSLTEKEK